MEPMKLEDLFPDQPEFYLKEKDKTYRLRIPNLGDQVWLKKAFKDENNLKKVFENLEWDEIAKFAYRLLVDRSDFPAQEATAIDDDGEQKKIKLSGPEVLLANITGVEEGLQIIAAINKAVALSSPAIDKAIQEELKKNLTVSPIGENSSISSQPNTDGQQSISSPVP
jgi:hypothetical protein